MPKAPARAADSQHHDEAGCRRLRAAGHIQRAVDCYRVLAGGEGVGAEVASFEAARIVAEKLGDTGRALRLLDEHTARFPAGALRAEARWLRVQCLERAGRFDEALSESEAMLAMTEARALAPELHWLRARIYGDSLNDCQRAVSELVSLIGEPDVRGDEAELRRAACLERLGRTGEARAAYERYLARPSPQRAEEARAKLESLRP